MSDGEANGNTHGEMDSGGEMVLSAGVGAGSVCNGGFGTGSVDAHRKQMRSV